MKLSEIQQTLRQHQLRPLKQLGQNFLFDENLCRFIVESLPLEEHDTVVEIGAGLGALTQFLLEKPIDFTAVEFDRGLANILRERFGSQARFRLIEGDALEEIPKLSGISRFIGNLPYNISTPLLIEILKKDNLPSSCVFLLQKEIGQRFCAPPKTKDYGAVTVFLQNFYDVELLKTIPPHVFYPQPKVHSTVVRLTKKNEAMSAEERAKFYAFLRTGFSQRRKMLKKVLPINSNARAEELSPLQWREFFEYH